MSTQKVCPSSLKLGDVIRSERFVNAFKRQQDGKVSAGYNRTESILGTKYNAIDPTRATADFVVLLSQSAIPDGHHYGPDHPSWNIEAARLNVDGTFSGEIIAFPYGGYDDNALGEVDLVATAKVSLQPLLP